MKINNLKHKDNWKKEQLNIEVPPTNSYYSDMRVCIAGYLGGSTLECSIS